MAKVYITFYGALTNIAKEKTVKVDGSALKDVIETLALKYDDLYL